MLKRLTIAGLAAAVLAACGEEEPLGLGGLVPDDGVRTFEVVLDAGAFLEADTSITGYSRPSAGGYVVVANAHGGVVHANGLVRFQLPLTSVTYKDAAGVTRTDNSPILVGGSIIAQIDSLRARPKEAVTLALYRIAEPWHAASANWTMRVDTGDVAEPWSTAGGARGTLVDRATIAAGARSVVFDVDSATLAAWSDTADASRGVLITAETPGSRVRFDSFLLELRARPSARPDTVVMDTTGVSAMTFVLDPPADAGAALLVGGTPTWRSYLRLTEGLDTVPVTVPCGEGECTYRLGDVTINYGALLLQPVASPAGFEPADSIALDIRTALGTSEIPISRAPIGRSILLAPIKVGPAVFAAGSDDPVEVPITDAVRLLAAGAAGSGSLPSPTLALINQGEGGEFGIAAFAPASAGESGPRLRLIFTVINEDGLQ